MLVIHDESLAERLRELAAQEHRPVEELLTDLLDRYGDISADMPSKPERQEVSEGVRRVRRKAYAKARQYWESVGDMVKAVLTDDELDKTFGRFDEEGIPRLKSEMTSLEPPPGSLAYAAIIAEQTGLRTGRPDLARRSDELLEDAFADNLRRQDGINDEE